MIRAVHWDPGTESAVRSGVSDEGELPGLPGAVLALRSGRGHPALELKRADGSSLTIATDGTRCALVWINALDESFHSTGGPSGPVLVYDCYGSWSEAPAEWAVPVPDALGCARMFLRHGAPDTESVVFEAA